MMRRTLGRIARNWRGPLFVALMIGMAAHAVERNQPFWALVAGFGGGLWLALVIDAPTLMLYKRRIASLERELAGYREWDGEDR